MQDLTQDVAAGDGRLVQRRVEEAEPAGGGPPQGQLALELVLQAKLLGVVALLAFPVGTKGQGAPRLKP